MNILCNRCKPTGARRMDKCMITIIESFKSNGYDTKGCCCGHGRYPITIVCVNGWGGGIYEQVSGKVIPRKRRPNPHR